MRITAKGWVSWKTAFLTGNLSRILKSDLEPADGK